MAASSLELQKACFAAIAADADVKSALKTVKVGGADILPVFDKVPSDIAVLFSDGAGPTYVTVGEGGETYELYGEAEDETDNVELTHHALTFHIWSQTIGMMEAKSLALLLRAALKKAYAADALVLDSNAIKAFDPVRIDYSRMEDMVTSHAAVTIKALTQPTS